MRVQEEEQGRGRQESAPSSCVGAPPGTRSHGGTLGKKPGDRNRFCNSSSLERDPDMPGGFRGGGQAPSPPIWQTSTESSQISFEETAAIPRGGVWYKEQSTEREGEPRAFDRGQLLDRLLCFCCLISSARELDLISKGKGNAATAPAHSCGRHQ